MWVGCDAHVRLTWKIERRGPTRSFCQTESLDRVTICRGLRHFDQIFNFEHGWDRSMAEKEERLAWQRATGGRVAVFPQVNALRSAARTS